MTLTFSAPYIYIPKNPLFRDIIEFTRQKNRFMQYIGFSLTKIEAGYMEGEAPFINALEQQDGLVHGGVIATVADLVTGFAAYSMVEAGNKVVTSDLKVSYFSPGKGQKIFARGWVVKPGKRLQYCEGEIYTVQNNEYQLIAKVLSIMAVIHEKIKDN